MHSYYVKDGLICDIIPLQALCKVLQKVSKEKKYYIKVCVSYVDVISIENYVLHQGNVHEVTRHFSKGTLEETCL